jgi:hypothetical protein
MAPLLTVFGLAANWWNWFVGFLPDVTQVTLSLVAGDLALVCL